MARTDYVGRGGYNCKCLIIFVIIIVACLISVSIILVSREKDDPDLPQYSVLDVVLSQNATVTDTNLLTADFTITLKATNTNKKNTTVFYGNTTHVSITRRIRQQVIASTSSPFIDPSSLGPGNSSNLTIDLHAQNKQFSFPTDDDTSPATVYDLVLRVRFRVGFGEGSNYNVKVLVTCYDLKCSFPTGFTADNSPTCKTEKVPYWQYFPGDEEQGRP